MAVAGPSRGLAEQHSGARAEQRARVAGGTMDVAIEC